MDFRGDTHRRILDSIQDGIYVVDGERKITFWSPGAERLTGFTAEEVIGRRCSDGILNHVDEQGNLLCGDGCPLLATMTDGRPRETRVFMHHRQGHRQPVIVQASPLLGEDGERVGATEVFRDDSEMATIRERLVELEEQALTDTLTGIGNRRHLEAVTVSWFAEWERYQRRFGLLLIDLDRLKEINDAWGHDIGDEALRMVAASMRFGLRVSDVVARISGDEFGALVLAETEEELWLVAERIRKLVACSVMETPDGPLGTTVSIGGALVEPGDTIDTLGRRTDRQLYLGKAAGRDRVVVGSAGDAAGAAASASAWARSTGVPAATTGTPSGS